MTPLQVLEETERLLQIGWCQHVFSQDLYKKPIWSLSEHACSWCLTGAVLRAAHGIQSTDSLGNIPTPPEYQLALYTLKQALKESGIDSVLSAFNDAASSVDEVIALVQKAKTLLP